MFLTKSSGMFGCVTPPPSERRRPPVTGICADQSKAKTKRHGLGAFFPKAFSEWTCRQVSAPTPLGLRVVSDRGLEASRETGREAKQGMEVSVTSDAGARPN